MRMLKNIGAYLIASALLSLVWYFLKPKPEEAEERVNALEGIQDKVSKYGDKMNATAEALDDVNVKLGDSTAEVLAGEDGPDPSGPGAQNPLSAAKSLRQADSHRSAAEAEVDSLGIAVESVPDTEIAEPSPTLNEPAGTAFVEPADFPRGPALETNTSLTGTVAPYKVVVAPGWHVYQGGADLHLGIGEGLRLAINAFPEASENQVFAGAALTDLVGASPGLKLNRQEMVTLDRRAWGRFDFGMAGGGEQVILFTHAGPLGGYTITVRGLAEEMVENQQSIVRLIGGFRFPPDNFGAKARSGVRVVVPE